MATVNMELPEDFTRGLTETIKQSALEAFGEVKERATTYPEYMTINQACEYLNVSRSTLNSKFIPAGLHIVQIETLMRVSKTECNRFMAENQI
ncbi:helix-turn-helix domain-containing protein [Secundilactobacillus yichangensis]|uniref:helix-turn-helix domain-containing protein n=1 Tax=Secundilactobacillus yichangensis TaxID=2799580 RepID=UPI001945B390|nr:helix-turn-helix domain-containing protein [Secundilactobacillus yichangensis]